MSKDFKLQIGQAGKILEYFGGKTGGVFIEAGAWDGEYLSNTLFLEVRARLVTAFIVFMDWCLRQCYETLSFEL